MTIQAIATRAVNQLRRDATYASDEVFIALTVRQNRIASRWHLVWVSDREAYFPEDETVRLNSRVHHIEDVATCESCEGFTIDTCQVNVRNRTGRLTQQIWCDYCQGENTFYCTGCDERWHDHECHSHEGESYCLECYDNLERDEVPSYHSAKRWEPESYSVPLYSFELELESEERGELIDQLNHSAYPKVSWEQDGSLDRSKGLEILIQLRGSLDKLATDTCNLVTNIKKRGFALSSWSNKKCGAHLNSNRSDEWNLKAIMRLLYCVRAAKEPLVCISGRESTQWASWDSRGYTLRKQANGDLGKYTMLRIGGDRMEWRMFRGTLNEKRIALYCETVKQFETLALSDTSPFKLKQAAIDLGNKLANTL
jgi:hypothetical protein